MKILNTVSELRAKALRLGNYRVTAKNAGVDESWLAKFAVGAAPNPTVKNLAKLEDYFSLKSSNDSNPGNLRL
jgi:hypothetical protein